MTVEEYFEVENIDMDFIEVKFDGPYWEKSLEFVSKNWSRDMESMTPKQVDWLGKILDDCVEKRITSRGYK